MPISELRFNRDSPAVRLRHPGPAAVLRHDSRESAVRQARRDRGRDARRAPAGVGDAAGRARRDGPRHAARRERHCASPAANASGCRSPAALLRKPRLFIFDEATSALDSITEQQITASVREISARKEHIVILIAHRLSTIAHADTIHVLEKGRIVETGVHERWSSARACTTRCGGSRSASARPDSSSPRTTRTRAARAESLPPAPAIL